MQAETNRNAAAVCCGIKLRSCIAVLLLLVSTIGFAAARTEEDAFQEVEGTGNWEYTIDVSDWEPGRYNILVRARDEAGNTALGGPFNVFVDPESDKPVASISYPQPNQAVGSRLFAVGTARDDDDVGYIEVQINDAPFVRATGTDYWSALLPLNTLADGPQTMRVRAVDINGTEGETVEVGFRLDTTKPNASPSSHESGVLVSRRTTISGTVDDANGVASLVLFDGTTRTPLRLRGGRDESPRFEFEIDPREMEDGSYVWWLESTDLTGASGATPFLFFVDTSPPELQILYPTDEDRIDAQLRFVGTVSDLVGVASLAYELSTGEEGSIPLTPGDPYWSLSVDLPPGSRGNLSATFTVTDVAENARSERLRLPLDSEGDLPVVTVHAPAEDGYAAGFLAGHIADDDTAAAIIYTVNGGAEQRLELEQDAGEGFALPLPDLPPGNHELRVRALDIHGTEGEEVRRRFLVAAPLPSISFTEILTGETSELYEPGFALAAGERASLRGTVTGTPESLPARISWFAGPESGDAGVDDTGSFTISLPRSTAGGPIPIEAIYANELGLVSRATGFLTQLPEVEEGASAPSVASLLPRGLLLTAGAIAPDADTPLPADHPVTLARGDSLALFAPGGAVSEPSLDPAVEFLSVRARGNLVILTAEADGAVSGLRVLATAGGTEVRSEPFALRTEGEAPFLEIPPGLTGRRFSSIEAIDLAASDPSGLAEVEIAVIAAPASDEVIAVSGYQTTTPSEAGDVYRAEPRLPPGEGPALVAIRATDRAGLGRELLVPIVVDRTPPELAVLTPTAEATVNGTITLQALLAEPNHTVSASASYLARATVPTEPEAATETTAVPAAAPNVTALMPDSLLTYQVASSETDGAVTLELVDTAGNRAEIAVTLQTDERADLPVLELQVPTEGGLVQQEFRVSGVLLDDDAPRSITFSIDEGEPRTVETDGTFDVDVPMTGLEDGDHTITIFGTDLGGARSDPLVRTFAISRSQPTTEVTAPTIESFQRGIITIAGTSADPNGVDRVEVSTDNNASFQLATGTTEWIYRLDTTLMDDGTHSILVRATDGAGESSLLSTTINVDNTPPVLELTEPSDGVSVSGTFLIDGRGEDTALRQVRLVAQPLGDAPLEIDPDSPGAEAASPDDSNPSANGPADPIELATFSTTGPFAYRVDTSPLPRGWYNLRVEAEDLAGNTNRIARNLLIEPPQLRSAPEILVPADGASIAHQFTVTVAAAPGTEVLTLLADGSPIAVIQLAENGVGSVLVEPGTIREGEVTLQARADATEGAAELVSVPHVISFAAAGPWVAVSNAAEAVPFLSFVRDRPFLSGSAGYQIELPEAVDRETERARRAIAEQYEIERVEVSLDNGRTFGEARGTTDWEYRIETTELTDGQHNLVVRAQFANGESAVVRHAVVVDELAPQVRLLEPQERDTFDESVRIVGITTDENPLQDVAVVLREGDKSRYSVPSFIQGLYVDFHALGATYWDAGAGLTFFDNNVRLQAQIGVAPPGRFSGLVMGAKLLANVASFPASFLFGPDLEWLSAALTVGANFSYFTMSDDEIAFTEEGLVLAGMLAQLEFPIVTVADLALFNTYSLYSEAQLWFISSDVQGGTAFRLGFGVRLNVF